jgi:pimeloyl-ACP methyl ester carboxylesterase
VAVTPADAATPRPAAPKPTVVFVHGAFADSSGWDGVMQRLRKDGYPVRAASNPLRGLAGDAAYVADLLHSISGPVILVGHSYGGAVITNAAAGAANVKALVYVAAFAPDAGESLGALSMRTVEHPVPRLPVDQVMFTEPDGSTGTRTLFASLNGPDGVAIDCAGNLYWASHNEGTVHVYAPSGTQLGVITVGRNTTNAAFGGPDGRTLFITSGIPSAGFGIYTTRLNLPGNPY